MIFQYFRVFFIFLARIFKLAAAELLIKIEKAVAERKAFRVRALFIPI